MTKQEQVQKNTKEKSNKLKPQKLKRYCNYLSQIYPMCQDPNCSCMAQDLHHSVYGSYGADKDDRTLIPLCNRHHIKAHQNKKEMQKIYIPIANQIWQEYCESD